MASTDPYSSHSYGANSNAFGREMDGSSYTSSLSASKPKTVQKLPWEEPQQKPGSNKLNSYRVSNSVHSGSVAPSGINTNVKPSRINSGSSVPMFVDDNENDTTPRSTNSNYYEEISSSTKQSLSSMYLASKKGSSYTTVNSMEEESSMDANLKKAEEVHRARKQSAPPTSKPSSKPPSRSSSRQSTRSENEDEYSTENVRGSVQRYDSAIKAVVNGAASPGKPRLSANRTKQPISGNSSSTIQTPKDPSPSVTTANAFSKPKNVKEAALPETRPVVGSKKSSHTWIQTSVTPLDLYYKPLELESIFVQPEEKPSRPKFKFIARKSGTTAIVQSTTRGKAAVVAQSRDSSVPSQPKSATKQVQPVQKTQPPQPQKPVPKRAPPPVYDDEEEEDEEEDDSYEEEEDEEEEEPPVKQPPKKQVTSKPSANSALSSTKKQQEPPSKPTKPTSKPVKKPIPSKEEDEEEEEDEEKPSGDVDNMQIKIVGNKDSKSLFEQMLEAEMRRGEAVAQEQETERKCPHCKDDIPVKMFAKHKRQCKEKHEKKRKVFKVDILDEDLAKEAAKVKSSAPVKTKPNNWRRKHEEFQRNVIRAGKDDKNGSYDDYEPEPVIDDRVQCEYCGRKFQEEVHERHVKSCAERTLKSKLKERANSGKSTVPSNVGSGSSSATGIARKNSVSSTASASSRQSSGLSSTRSKQTPTNSGRKY
ncbi:hypothetical protein C9374_008696 [Naegleria lovaniensis]|uniref:C2HC/C3H-type domain-containing protein n=1 Tax=Naegleria lovaniensis TaxID=51637 RepID=A0AA88KKQ6_NAELO|nr:uncharacterized protein C9374_008696 [Naegleria lovaniensis]KAG2378074.1 hypothetical protein C9374_008696 [Naegleria lovaniensis]